MSQTDIIPMPPPKALPSTLAINGLGKLYILFKIFANLYASLMRVFLSEFICSFIQSKSPPAQKDLPLADIITNLILLSLIRLSKVIFNSSIINGDKALCLSG